MNGVKRSECKRLWLHVCYEANWPIHIRLQKVSHCGKDLSYHRRPLTARFTIVDPSGLEGIPVMRRKRRGLPINDTDTIPTRSPLCKSTGEDYDLRL